MGGGSTVYDSSGNESYVYDDSGSSSSVASSSWVRRDDNEYDNISNSKNGQGYYHFDYKYVEDSGNLDNFNGGYALIDNEYTYAYFVTTEYPGGIRNLRGKVSSDVYTTV